MTRLDTLSTLRAFQRLAAALAIAALCLLPALHAPHVRHAGPGIDATTVAVASHAVDAPTPCPLCVFTGQARTAAPAASAPAIRSSSRQRATFIVLRAETEPQPVSLDAAPPRAPPA